MNGYDPKKDGIYTIDELKARTENAKLSHPPLIEMHDDDQTFEVTGSSWWAKYSSVDTPEKMLACIYHLSTKAWIKTSHIHELIAKFSDRYNFQTENYNAMD